MSVIGPLRKYKAQVKQLQQAMAEQQAQQTYEAEGVADDLKIALEASEAECERLRGVLKELQDKMSTLKSTAATVDERLSTMIEESGLAHAINAGLGTCGIRGVFRRLYDDAMERLVRMAELRHRRISSSSFKGIKAKRDDILR